MRGSTSVEFKSEDEVVGFSEQFGGCVGIGLEVSIATGRNEPNLVGWPHDGMLNHDRSLPRIEQAGITALAVLSRELIALRRIDFVPARSF